MKGLLTSIFAVVFVMSFACTNALADDNTGNLLPQSTAQVDIPDVDVNCTAFDCPISTERAFEGCIRIDDCKGLTDAQIKRIINAFFNRVCEKLKECCAANGCDEFKCELLDSKAECRDEQTLCVKIKVAWKCA